MRLPWICSGALLLSVACGARTGESFGDPSASGGAPGSGGAGAGGSGGEAAKTATVSITTAPGRSFCTDGCGDGIQVAITTRDGVTVDLGSTCEVDCTTCSSGPCPGIICGPPSAVIHWDLVWDGHYFSASSCGSGTLCNEPAVAKAGAYYAVFCATPGTLVTADDGATFCAQPGPQECGNVLFEFPSEQTVHAVLGK